MAALSACVTSNDQAPAEGIGFRQARHQEIQAMRDWRACRDQALELDAKARVEAASARYLASARLIESCESDLGSEVAGRSNVAKEERMRAYALGIQNHFKGGDVEAARRTLATFKEHFVGQDLYYPDGASFVETMEVLLGLKDRTAVGAMAMTNVNDELKAELRRMRYWTSH
jgi:hypothetical protein